MSKECVDYLNSVPESQKAELARFALAVTEAVFSRPGEEERYQEWLQNRRKREKEAAGE